MKLLIVGGHLAPALGVINELPNTISCVYVGRKYTFEGDKAVSLEYQTITGMKIPFIELRTGRWQRIFTRYTIPSLLKIPFGFFHACSLLREQKPDVILSFGGFISLPVCITGFLLGTPIVIHEQTLEAGLANKIVGRFAKKICISWKSSSRFFPKNKTVFTGNPLLLGQKETHCTYTAVFKKTIPILCIVGGSSGSHAINALVERCLPDLLQKYQVIHQTGDAQEFKDYERMQRLKSSLNEKLNSRYLIYKFIEPEHITCVLQSADIIVSRAGINTVTTLILLNKPTLFIPLPASQRDEQRKNAIFMKSLGLADVLDQNSLTSEKLFDNIVAMMNNRNSYRIVTAPSEVVAPQKAAKHIIDVISHIYEENKKKEN